VLFPLPLFLLSTFGCDFCVPLITRFFVSWHAFPLSVSRQISASPSLLDTIVDSIASPLPSPLRLPYSPLVPPGCHGLPFRFPCHPYHAYTPAACASSHGVPPPVCRRLTPFPYTPSFPCLPPCSTSRDSIIPVLKHGGVVEPHILWRCICPPARGVECHPNTLEYSRFHFALSFS